MKQIALLDPSEEAEWDAFVASHRCGWVCHLSRWKRVVEQSFPHIQGSFLTLRENGSIRAGLPLYEVSSWLTGRRMVSIPYATLSQPLVEDDADFSLLASEAVRIAHELRAKRIEIRGIGEISKPAEGGACISDRFVVHSLDLSVPEETLWKHLHKSCVRRRIDKSTKAGARTRSISGENDLPRFYRMYCLTRRRIGLPPQPESFVRALWRAFAAEGLLEIRVAEVNGRIVAGILLLKFGTRVSAEFIVSEEKGGHQGALQHLCWDAIQAAKSGGFEVFDFGRTDEENIGLMDFKGRWGTQIERLPTLLIPVEGEAPCPTGGESRARRVLGLICRQAPLPVLRALGTMCYRHLG